MEKQLKLGQFDLLENASSRFGPQLLDVPTSHRLNELSAVNEGP